MNTKELELILDGKSTQSTSGQVWTITKFLTGALWCTSKFVVKNTPAALGMAWEVKKEISNEIAQGIHEYQLEQKQLELENQIKQLKEAKKKDTYLIEDKKITELLKDI
jgi:aspartate/tyrosine/aromatic aminotransferase